MTVAVAVVVVVVVVLAAAAAAAPTVCLELCRDFCSRRCGSGGSRCGLLRHRPHDPLHAQALRHAHGAHLDGPRALHDVDARVRDRACPEVLQQVPGLQAAKLGVGVLVVPDHGRGARLDIGPRRALAKVVEDGLDRVHPLLFRGFD